LAVFFGLSVPSEVPGVEPHILTPHETWADKADFAAIARRLNALFAETFRRFEAHVDSEVKRAAPGLQSAA